MNIVKRIGIGIILGLAVFKLSTALIPDVGLGLYKEAVFDAAWGLFYLGFWFHLRRAM